MTGAISSELPSDWSGASRVGAEPTSKSTRAGSRVTDRVFWIALFIVTTGLTLVRLPAVYRDLPSRMPPETLSKLGDPSLVEWSLKIGTALAVVLSLFCLGIIALLASAMERGLFPRKLATRRGRGVGVYFLCVLFAVVPPQIYGALTAAVRPEKGIPFYAYMVAVIVLVPLLFWRTFSGLPARRIVILYLSVALLVLGLSIG